MTSRKLLPLEQYNKSLQVRGMLFLLQLLLPFGLYFALKSDSNMAAMVIAGIYVLSMLCLVWLG